MKKIPIIRTIDDYIAGFPGGIQKTLSGLRRAIRAAAPAAVERIAYRMPALYLDGPLVYFAAFKDHISFFPTSSGVEAFRHELSPFEISKGTIRFPLGRPLPLKLIARIVRFRVAENRNAARLAAARKK